MSGCADRDECRLWLTLSRAEGLGAIGQRKLLGSFPSIQHIFDAGPHALRACGLKARSIKSLHAPDEASINADLAWLDHPHHHLVTMNSDDYPPLLKNIPDPPPILFACGCLEALQGKQVAIVGSRNPDRAGIDVAEELARGLVSAGAVVTSGLAMGIDGHGHQGALDAGGYTVAVAGNGLDIIYPSQHKALAERIVEQGVLVSEQHPGAKPLAAHFPRRNRIISGMSMGVVVVQATLNSGSLITAQYAVEQGREVFAVPGSIRNAQAKGCHALIKQGAKLVESVEDVIEELATLAVAVTHERQVKDDIQIDHEFDDDHKMLLEAMAYDPISIDRLIEVTGLTAESVSSMLLILELRGLVVSQAGGFYLRV